jgi:short-subunit dehydrogenase
MRPGAAELAKQLYRSGAKVILSSRGRPALEKVRDECVGEHPVDNTYAHRLIQNVFCP